MGEHEALSQAGKLLLNGLLPNETSKLTGALDAERWSKVEERAAELIVCIQPNRQSEERRNAVTNYVQTLIKKCFSCEVCTFGSVALKTYISDADIDLTVCSKSKDMKDTWANAILKVLENEKQHINNSEFCVKEVIYIHAEVRVIKCLVEQIIVDTFLCQIGGLCTLKFLEEVEHLVSQKHLFKRSIILIKDWCHYESRIFGAHSGLISTYTLEILILYIFHVFNNSFAGLFEVLYRFLEVFNNFDWHRFLEVFNNFDWQDFYFSLWGSVPISSLPDVTTNFYRIHSVFTFGAKKMVDFLDCP